MNSIVCGLVDHPSLGGFLLTWYPTGLLDGSAATAFRMSTNPADSIFPPLTVKGAVIRSIHLGQEPAGPDYALVEAGSGKTVWSTYGNLRQPQWTPGPFGFGLPGGFYLTISGAFGDFIQARINIVYDVV